MKSLSRLLLAPTLAAVLLLACAPTKAARRVDGSAYDGTWSVAIYTQRGDCSSVRVATRIVGGRVYSEDQSYQANGGVGADGVIRVSISGFGRSASGSGRLSHAGIVNDISKVHQEFLNDGGLGILVGDGMLPHPGLEQIIETYYAFPLLASTVTFDYQFIVTPAYNRARGPVSVIGARMHFEF
jgi:Carbohydrate-selective porin, OprB family